MRELTVRIRFTAASLGDVKEAGKSGNFVMPKDPNGRVTFMTSWHSQNMKFAAKLLGRHQDEVSKIHWDMVVDGIPRRWHRRFYTNGQRTRYVQHECFENGQVVGINCVVPSKITDDDFWQLMELAGRYCGLSPYRPRHHGLFEVVSLRERRALQEGETKEPDELATRPAQE